MFLLALQRRKETAGLTYRDRQYEKKIQGVNTVTAEPACVDAIQRQVDFANKHVLRNFKLSLVMEAEK